MRGKLATIRGAVWTTVLTLCLFDGCPVHGADAKLKGPTVIEGQLTHAADISGDELAATVIFDNLQAVLDSYNGDLPVKTRVATLSLPLKDATQEVCITYQIRGYVSTAKSSRAALVVHVGDTTQVVDLAKAAAAKPGPVTERVTQTRKEALAKLTPRKRSQPLDDDFFVQFTTAVPAGNTHKVTLFLLVERDGVDAADAYLQVDTLDCEIIPIKK
jgi:hypothetical protein